MNKLSNLAQAEKYKIFIWDDAFGIQKEWVLFGSRGHFPHIAQIDIEEIKKRLIKDNFLSDIEYSIDYHSINPTTRLDSIKTMDSNEIAAMRPSFVQPSFYSLFPEYILKKQGDNQDKRFNSDYIPEQYFDQIIPWAYNISAPRENVEIYLENFATPINKNGERLCKRGINGLIKLYNNEGTGTKLEKIISKLSEAYHSN